MPDSTPKEERKKLEAEERALSKRREKLHDRIDFLRTVGADEPDAAERVAALLEEERVLAERRTELHALLDT